MKTPSILVIGSINMDLILKVEKVPERGESFIESEYLNAYGGKGENQAVAAKRLGSVVTMLGKVGKDASGFELIEHLKKEGIRTDYIDTDDGIKTGLAVIILEKTGDNRILVYPGANMHVQKEQLYKVFNNHFDAVITQFEIPDEIIYEASKICKEKNIPLIIDAGPAKQFNLEDIAYCEVLSPNETETLALTGINVGSYEDAEMAAKVLKERSKARYIVIKMGGRGSALYDGIEFKAFEPYKVKAVDTTAAGDAFTAALTYEYILSGDIQKSINFANAVGALTTTKIGAIPSLPSMDEVKEFINR